MTIYSSLPLRPVGISVVQVIGLRARFYRFHQCGTCYATIIEKCVIVRLKGFRNKAHALRLWRCLTRCRVRKTLLDKPKEGNGTTVFTFVSFFCFHTGAIVQTTKIEGYAWSGLASLRLKLAAMPPEIRLAGQADTCGSRTTQVMTMAGGTSWFARHLGPEIDAVCNKCPELVPCVVRDQTKAHATKREAVKNFLSAMLSERELD